MLRLFSSMTVLAIGLVLGSYSANASDQPCEKPASSPAPVAVSASGNQVPEAETLPAALTQAAQKTAEHVQCCHDEVAVQQQLVDQIKARSEQAVAARQLSVSVLGELREILSTPGCSVCVEGKLYSKETIAAAIEKKLSTFREQSTIADAAQLELKNAQTKLDELVVKAKRWEAAQSLLLSELDRVLNAKTDLAKQAEAQQAEQDALQLAEAITAKISKAKAPVQPPVVRPVSSVKIVVPAVVSQAIAEFEAIFGK